MRLNIKVKTGLKEGTDIKETSDRKVAIMQTWTRDQKWRSYFFRRRLTDPYAAITYSAWKEYSYFDRSVVLYSTTDGHSRCHWNMFVVTKYCCMKRIDWVLRWRGSPIHELVFQGGMYIQNLARSEWVSAHWTVFYSHPNAGPRCQLLWKKQTQIGIMLTEGTVSRQTWESAGHGAT